MNFISLPEFYNNFRLNNTLKLLYNKEKNNLSKYFKIPHIIQSVHGAFPYSTWNGDVSSNSGKLPLYNDFIELGRTSFSPVRLNCSNLLLTEQDMSDNHQTVIFEALNDSGNLIEVADIGLLEFLQHQYPNYLYVISANMDLLHPFSVDIINGITDNDDVYLVELPSRLSKDLSALEALNNKNKIEIIIGNRCGICDDSKCDNCKLTENYNQIQFSQKSIYAGCPLTNPYTDNNEISAQIDFFNKLGFTHFKIDAPPFDKHAVFQQYLINNLLTSEGKEKFNLLFKEATHNGN